MFIEDFKKHSKKDEELAYEFLVNRNDSSDFISMYKPSYIYSFWYTVKSGKPNDILQSDKTPVILCCNVESSYIDGINFEFLPNDIRAAFLDKIYYGFESFYKNIDTQNTYNKELASLLINDKDIKQFFTVMDTVLKYPISTAYRRYYKENIKCPKLISFNNWSAIPHLIFKDFYKASPLINNQLKTISKINI